jgi:hypothetical protein
MTEPPPTEPHVTEPHGDDPTPERVERATRTISAPAQVIFDLLADPRQHGVIDGSGSVRDAASNAPERLALGTRFGMSMRVVVPYRMTNEVVEFEEGRRIGWRHGGGHIWRYLLDPVDESTTVVTEEFDWRPSKVPWLLRLTGAATRNRAALDATLAKLAAHVERPAS